MNIKKEMNKRGQLSIFVILGVAIVAVLLILTFPSIKEKILPKDPEVKLGNCLQDKVQESLDKILPKGGSLEPELYYVYDEEKVEYLCYTNMWYVTCAIQKPLLKQSIEKEVEKMIQPTIDECVKQIENSLKNKGYSYTTTGSKQASLEILPDNIRVQINATIIAKKDEYTKEYKILQSSFKSGVYKMIMIATSIMNWEAHYGNSDPQTYMGFYTDMKIEKKKQSDGTTIYIITDRNSEKKFQFASRSLAWPPGYAIQPNLK